MAKNAARFLALLYASTSAERTSSPKTTCACALKTLGLQTSAHTFRVATFCFDPRNECQEADGAIEVELSDRFSYDARAVILPHRKYKSAVAAAPDGWGTDNEYKHNALFTLSKTTPKKVLSQLAAPKSHIQTVTTGPGVIFWSASRSHLTKTAILKLARRAVYQQLMVRNHNTVFKLLELFDA